MTSIDVVIPSYRLQSEYLLPIVQMDIPPEIQVRFFIIADNPKTDTPKELIPLIDNKIIHLIRNASNLGVCRTRNVGIDASAAEWILFIDDDVKPAKNLLFMYLQAMKENPGEIGFFGETIFPKPVNIFTQGLTSSVILTFFTIGRRIDHLKWAPTPNVLIKRAAIGDVRFNEIFDKFGASEEIDFFLRINRNTGKDLRSVKNANVYHNWWHGGKRNYSRFIRWAGGFTILIKNFPEYSFYSFPNMIESLLLGVLFLLPISLYIHSPLLFACFLAGLFAGECCIEFINILLIKGLYKSIFTIESVLIRSSMDIGKLLTQFKYLKVFQYFCKRFNHFCDSSRIARMRRFAAFKFIAYIFYTALFYYLIYT